jgi:DNA helicase IV
LSPTARDPRRGSRDCAPRAHLAQLDAADLSRLVAPSNSGRKLPKRTVSTPLLLKGLEFDHVVIPDATHFAHERKAQAKLFYVAISRATRSLTLSSSQRVIQLPPPAR